MYPSSQDLPSAGIWADRTDEELGAEMLGNARYARIWGNPEDFVYDQEFGQEDAK